MRYFQIKVFSISWPLMQFYECRFPTLVFQTRAVKSLTLTILGTCICMLSGCGGGPSNGDIEAAVRKHFATDIRMSKGQLLSSHPGFHFHFPEGFNGVDIERCNLAEVSVRKVGNGYTNDLTPGLGKVYPVRVFVKGTARSSEGGERAFEGDIDLQVRYAPPDQSRVESGSGAWEVWDMY